MSYELKLNNPSNFGDVIEQPAEDLGLVSLEPRILLDAAGFVTGAEVAMDAMIAEGAQQGVDAIFETGDLSGGETSAAPRGGPWLGEIALAEDVSSGGETSAAPRGGPWLGEIALAEDVSSGGETFAAPRGGPWLGEIALAEDVLSGGETSAAPRGGPWL